MKLDNDELLLVEHADFSWGDDEDKDYIIAQLRHNIMEAWFGFDWPIKVLSKNYPTITSEQVKRIKTIKKLSGLNKLGDSDNSSALFWRLFIYNNPHNEFSLRIFDDHFPPLPLHMRHLKKSNSRTILELISQIEEINKNHLTYVFNSPNKIRKRKLLKFFRDPKSFITDSKIIKKAFPQKTYKK